MQHCKNTAGEILQGCDYGCASCTFVPHMCLLLNCVKKLFGSPQRGENTVPTSIHGNSAFMVSHFICVTVSEARSICVPLQSDRVALFEIVASQKEDNMIKAACKSNDTRKPSLSFCSIRKYRNVLTSKRAFHS